MSREKSNKELFFITGIGRSGTTILTQLLNNHPQIHSLPEADFFVFFLHRFKDKKTFSQFDIDLIFKQIEIYSKSHPWIGWDFDAEQTKQFIIAKLAAGNLTYIDICKIIYQNFRVTGKDKSDSKILLDKNPSYTLFTNHIKYAVPSAKFILLVRDYRANVLSRKQSHDLKSPVVAFNALRWKLFNKVALKFYKKNPGKVLIVKYENLIANSSRELNNICDFFEIDQRNLTIENTGKKKAAVPDHTIAPQFKERFEKKYSDLNKPLNSSRSEAWKTQLTESEINICDAVCSDFAGEFGYSAFRKLNLVSKIKIKTKYCLPLIAAYIDVKKDLLIYYVNPSYKLKRLQKKYTQLGFFKKQ